MDTPESLRAERDALRAERDALLAEVAKARVPGRGHWVRGLAVAFLVVIAVLSVPLASVGVWANRNVLDTERFVQEVGPLADDPYVQAVLADKLTDDLMELVDPEALFEDVLPDKGQILAAPLAGAVENFVHDHVLKFMKSEEFKRLWINTNETAHRAIVHLIEGNDANVEATDDKIVINLVPIIDAALTRLGEKSPELLGRSIDLPTLTVDDVPAAARNRIQRALGRPVGTTFGEITVYDQGKLAAVQSVMTIFERIRIISLVALVVSVPLALWLSRRRRRTLLQLLVGISFGMIVVRRLALTAQEHVVDLSQVSTTQKAIRAATAVFVGPLASTTRWIVASLLAIAVIVVLTGPYPWAVAMRNRIGRGARVVWHALAGVGDAGGDTLTIWVRSHEEATRIGGAVLAGLVMWQVDLGWWGVLVLLVALFAFDVAVRRIARPLPDEPTP